MSIQFFTDPNYEIGWCTDDGERHPFPATFPTEQVKIWTITKTDISLKIECNGVDLATYKFSDSTRSTCLEHWGPGVERTQIKFIEDDKASDAFRVKPSGLSDTILGIHYATNP